MYAKFSSLRRNSWSLNASKNIPTWEVVTLHGSDSHYNWFFRVTSINAPIWRQTFVTRFMFLTAWTILSKEHRRVVPRMEGGFECVEDGRLFDALVKHVYSTTIRVIIDIIMVTPSLSRMLTCSSVRRGTAAGLLRLCLKRYKDFMSKIALSRLLSITDLSCIWKIAPW